MNIIYAITGYFRLRRFLETVSWGDICTCSYCSDTAPVSRPFFDKKCKNCAGKGVPPIPLGDLK